LKHKALLEIDSLTKEEKDQNIIEIQKFLVNLEEKETFEDKNLKYFKLVPTAIDL
jgi:hypothetical protein